MVTALKPDLTLCDRRKPRDRPIAAQIGPIVQLLLDDRAIGDTADPICFRVRTSLLRVDSVTRK